MPNTAPVLTSTADKAARLDLIRRLFVTPRGTWRDNVNGADVVEAITAILDAPATTPDAAILTMDEFRRADFGIAEEFARRLGYSQHAYTSTSALWGLFCLPENPERARPGEATKGGAIVRTRELGFLFVQNLEDHRHADLMARERRTARR